MKVQVVPPVPQARWPTDARGGAILGQFFAAPHKSAQ
jgi:hypothetical protein